MNFKMKDLNHYVDKYKKQLNKGDIQKAYAGLVKYVTRLGTTLSKNLSKDYTVGNLSRIYGLYLFLFYQRLFEKAKVKNGSCFKPTKMQFEIWLLG